MLLLFIDVIGCFNKLEPYLTYGCIVWARLIEKTTYLEVLYKLQKRAAKIIMFVHHLNHYL